MGSGFWSDWDQGFVVMRKRQVTLTPEQLRAPQREDPRELDAAAENVCQLGRQLTPFWIEMIELRARQAQLRGRVKQLRAALERERSVQRH